MPLTILLWYLSFTLYAQAPQSFNYQAACRDTMGIPLSNQAVRYRASILQSSPSGTIIYQETHTDTTNIYGISTLQIGRGTSTQGIFATIPWVSGSFYLSMEIDPTGGNNYRSLGTPELLSVPYALFSSDGLANGTLPNQMVYWNGTVWDTLNPGNPGQMLTLCNGNLIWGTCPGTITSLDCSNAQHSGTLIEGVAAVQISSTIAYTGGNGGIHAGQTIASTGVSGLIATCTSGYFGNGSGTVTYSISGTPAGNGTASFAITLGGQNCTLTRVVDPGLITGLSCSTAVHSGNLVQGVVANGVSSVISYTGGNAGSYNAQTISSTGVTGLTATLSAGNFVSGNGTISYTVSGTPAGNGTASFAITLGGQNCSLTRVVNPGLITGLSCSTAVHSGSLVQGLVASGVSSVISYTGGNAGPYSAQSISSTGVTGLTATLSAGNFVSGNGTISYTVSGTPAGNGTASFAITLGGQNCTLTRVVDPGLITGLSCSTAVHSGTLIQGLVSSGVSSVISYTGGNAGPYSAQTISSTGVTGLTATLTAGNFVSGNGTISYTVSGTPVGNGTASFAITLGGQNCTLTRVVNPGLITGLSCSTAVHSGSLVQGVVANGVSSVISYTGGNAGPYSAQTISSTGVTGLTATLTAGNFVSGNGTISYTISGTPAGNGTASFAISLGGQNCTLTRVVDPGLITGLSCSTAVHSGNLVQGVVANGVSSVISYTGGNAGSYNVQTISSTGVTGLTATLSAGNFVSGNGTISYTISGTPAGNGTASFAISLGGQNCTLTRVVDPGLITGLSCSTAVHSGNLVQGVVANGVSSVISYTGGNAGSYNAQTISSTGVTGLTATLTAGNFVSGNGTISYTLSGTPAGNGTASFAITLGEQNCTLTRVVDPSLITGLSCSTAVHSGTLVQGGVANGVSSVISYTGGNAGPYSAQTISSTGVLGLTATLTAGNFVSGNGTVTYTISGIPAGNGTASFAITIGGQSCTLTRVVDGLISSLSCNTAVHSGSLVQGGGANGVSSVISYTGGNAGPYSAQTIASTGVLGLTATLTAGNFVSGNGTISYTVSGTPAGNGTASFAITLGGQNCTLTRVVDPGLITGLSCSTAVHSGTLIQGLMASGVSSSISYTGGNSGPYSAQTISSTGVAGLTATLTAGNFVSGNGTISYTVSGTPAGNGTASFAITIGGQICTLTRTVLPIWRPGMVHCGSPTQVVPVTNPATGKTWMDRNLGASGVAVSSTDDNAKGDWYQWGRFGDGHQCRNSGGQYNNPSNTDTPGHSNFILGYSDWRSPQNNNLWQGVNGINNPCPNGYRLPTEAEFLGEINSWTGGRNSNGAFSSWLKFVLGGYRSYSDGSSAYYNQRGYYSTSTTNGNWAIQVVAIYQFSAPIETFQSRAGGISVRCIKD